MGIIIYSPLNNEERTGRFSASDAMPSVAGSENTMPRNRNAPRK